MTAVPTWPFSLEIDMKILVTGANGFVGGRLCHELSSRRIDFVGAARVAGNGLLAIGDLSQDTNWSVALNGVSAVVHLAARVHVMDETEADPLQAFLKVNVDAAVHLARQAAAAGVKRFVFVSSVKVNGEATTRAPFSESDRPAPEDAYGVSKYRAELALAEVAEASGLELVIVRPPLVYGPGVKANFLNLMRAVYKGLPLPLGAVHNARSMVALDNLVDFLITAATHEKAAGRTFLISDDHDIGTAELARELASAMHRRARLIPVPAPLLQLLGKVSGKSAFIDRLTGSLQVDVTQARETLSWHPRVSVREGIERTVAHFLATRSTGS